MDRGSPNRDGPSLQGEIPKVDVGLWADDEVQGEPPQPPLAWLGAIRPVDNTVHMLNSYDGLCVCHLSDPILAADAACDE